MSRKRSESSISGLKKSDSRKSIDGGLCLNLKDMYSIEEGVENELETSRSRMLNLRNELKMQNLSECPSVEPRMYGN